MSPDDGYPSYLKTTTYAYDTGDQLLVEEEDRDDDGSVDMRIDVSR